MPEGKVNNMLTVFACEVFQGALQISTDENDRMGAQPAHPPPPPPKNKYINKISPWLLQ